jgi:hemerythrin superfamily protein
MLFEELLAHNGREEYALYPELDGLLSNSEKETLYEPLPVSAGVGW